MSNPRLRGKISHTEWPNIARRHDSGESLAAIARSYGCTAPAIRYIVHRMQARSQEVSATRNTLADTSRPTSPSRGRESVPTESAVWSRINRDIAAFLTAVDTLIVQHSNQNEEALLRATDSLLRASARTRIELERSMSRRKESTRSVGKGQKLSPPPAKRVRESLQ
jgi:transposase-like protein